MWQLSTGLASIADKLFDKQTSGSATEKELLANQHPSKLTGGLHKIFIKKFEKRKVFSQSK